MAHTYTEELPSSAWAINPGLLLDFYVDMEAAMAYADFKDGDNIIASAPVETAAQQTWAATNDLGSEADAEGEPDSEFEGLLGNNNELTVMGGEENAEPSSSATTTLGSSAAEEAGIAGPVLPYGANLDNLTLPMMGQEVFARPANWVPAQYNYLNTPLEQGVFVNPADVFGPAQGPYYNASFGQDAFAYSAVAEPAQAPYFDASLGQDASLSPVAWEPAQSPLADAPLGTTEVATAVNPVAAPAVAAPATAPEAAAPRARGRPKKAAEDKKQPTFYHCRFCNHKPLKSSEGLVHHMSIEHQIHVPGRKTLPCDVCGKLFPRQCDLNKHLRGEKNDHEHDAMLPKFNHPWPSTREELADTFALPEYGPVANRLVCGREHLPGRPEEPQQRPTPAARRARKAAVRAQRQGEVVDLTEEPTMPFDAGIEPQAVPEAPPAQEEMLEEWEYRFRDAMFTFHRDN